MTIVTLAREKDRDLVSAQKLAPSVPSTCKVPTVASGNRLDLRNENITLSVRQVNTLCGRQSDFQRTGDSDRKVCLIIQ